MLHDETKCWDHYGVGTFYRTMKKNVFDLAHTILLFKEFCRVLTFVLRLSPLQLYTNNVKQDDLHVKLLQTHFEV